MNELNLSFDLFHLWQVTGGQLILIIAGLVLICADMAMLNQDEVVRSRRLGWLTVIIFALTAAHMMSKQWDLHNTVFMGIFSADKFSIFVSIVMVLSGLLAALMSIGYLENNKVMKGEYYVLLVYAVAGAVGLVQSVDLLMMFITLEVMSLAIYALAAFLKDNQFSQEGALKYFLLGSFGSAIFLFGVALIYGVTGTINLTNIAQSISGGLYENPAILLAFVMLTAGLFFKMAMVPFHMWTPDVYEGSPSVVTGFMATAVKAAAFGVFVKLLFVSFTPMLSHSGQPDFSTTVNLSALGAYWKPVIWWSALLTMFFGNLLAVSQQNVKRMLAYSSIAHAGYMALGILAANGDGRMGILFYLFAYTLMNFGAFGVIYIIDGKERCAQTLDDYRGLGYKYPSLGFLMGLFLVAMAGLPPTAGFIAKFYVFSAAIKEGYFLLAALGILTSVIGAYYYLRVIYMMYMKEEIRDVVRGPIAGPTVIALVITALGVIYLGILPERLADIANIAQQSLAMIF
ncbi:MAG: NADH-quinone oxidoreductase subunit N [Thermodesulfatator sp.]|nr:MAG: NADH-quinone oxidoreductase subunit N [Thermodesulfatator sp.]